MTIFFLSKGKIQELCGLNASGLSGQWTLKVLPCGSTDAFFIGLSCFPNGCAETLLLFALTEAYLTLFEYYYSSAAPFSATVNNFENPHGHTVSNSNMCVLTERIWKVAQWFLIKPELGSGPWVEFSLPSCFCQESPVLQTMTVVDLSLVWQMVYFIYLHVAGGRSWRL